MGQNKIRKRTCEWMFLCRCHIRYTRNMDVYQSKESVRISENQWKNSLNSSQYSTDDFFSDAILTEMQWNFSLILRDSHQFKEWSDYFKWMDISAWILPWALHGLQFRRVTLCRGALYEVNSSVLAVAVGARASARPVFKLALNSLLRQRPFQQDETVPVE